MKATGIVRRIDELGRVVIPKEIRRTQRIRQGDALEIFTAADGQVVFKKYSPLVELGELAGVYAEVLAKNLGRPVLICDRESIVAATGTGKGQLLGRQISDAAARLLAMRGPYTAPETAARRITAFDKGETVLLCVCPIVVQGDVEGGVLLTGRPQDAAPDAETARAVNIAAAFLAKWMEELTVGRHHPAAWRAAKQDKITEKRRGGGQKPPFAAAFVSNLLKFETFYEKGLTEQRVGI